MVYGCEWASAQVNNFYSFEIVLKIVNIIGSDFHAGRGKVKSEILLSNI